jgi:N-dimethylarginine dimethylaminohydrolase
MLSKNEWDPLQRVIVGRANGARIPVMDTSLRTINYSHLSDVDQIPQGLYPQQVIDEANEDLEGICNFLTSLGIQVDRPDTTTAPGYYHYCPRDSVCVFEDLVVETPMPLRARKQESRAFEHVFSSLTDKFRWIKLQAKRQELLYNTECVGNPDILALTEIEASFDAANVLRCNRDIFYLVSNSGNRAGANLLQDLLGKEYRVWPIENIYSYMHIDSTISLMREGLMLLNPDRIKDKSVLPKPLQSWDAVWAPDPGEPWHYPGYCNSSKWSSMNILSVNPSLVLVEQRQTELAAILKKHRVESQLLPMRHSITLGGSFHCVTLDLERKHD